MLPKRHAPILFGLILSGCMSLIVSGIATWRAVSLPPDFAGLWLSAWLNAWLVAFPTILLLGPLVRRLVASVTRPD